MLGIMNSLFVIFIDFSMNEDNILDWYYKLIMTINNQKIAKLLGGCIVCFGFWINLICFNLYYFLLLDLPFSWKYILIIPYIGISQFILINSEKLTS